MNPEDLKFGMRLLHKGDACVVLRTLDAGCVRIADHFGETMEVDITELEMPVEDRSGTERYWHLYALANLCCGTPVEVLRMHIEQQTFTQNKNALAGMRRALELVATDGLVVDKEALKTWARREELGQQRFVTTRLVPREDLVSMVLMIDAPWMKQAMQMSLNLDLRQVFAAFAPLPRDHDVQLDNSVYMHELREQVNKISEQREKAMAMVVEYFTRALKQWINAHDPVKGLFPKNHKVA